MWGITLLQKGFPHKLSGSSNRTGERKKSAISRKSDKNKQYNKIRRTGRKQANCRFYLHERAQRFSCNESANAGKIVTVGAIHGRGNFTDAQCSPLHYNQRGKCAGRAAGVEPVPRPTILRSASPERKCGAYSLLVRSAHFAQRLHEQFCKSVRLTMRGLISNGALPA